VSSRTFGARVTAFQEVDGIFTMVNCPFEITGPKTLARGETAKYQLSPIPDGALCNVQWSINDQPLRVSSTYADLFTQVVYWARPSFAVTSWTSRELSFFKNVEMTSSGNW
jgi:hypothetical protein